MGTLLRDLRVACYLTDEAGATSRHLREFVKRRFEILNEYGPFSRNCQNQCNLAFADSFGFCRPFSSFADLLFPMALEMALDAKDFRGGRVESLGSKDWSS